MNGLFRRIARCIAAGVAGLVAVALARPAIAASPAPYQGIYVVMNPYAPLDVANMQLAATTPCVAGKQSTVTPFCGSANGILLRIPWCDFQLYHLTNSRGVAYPSCHYFTSFSNGANSAGMQNPETDTVSPCPGTYDICSGRSQSTLSRALQYISQISAQRAKIGLGPVQLSIGLYAGIGTPQAIFDTMGYVDVAHNNNANLTAATVECYRLPLPWKSQFLSSYAQALGQLLAYIPTQMPQGANIKIIKAAAITATDLEIEEPGQPTPVTAPGDPGPATRGGLLKCNNAIAGAQSWLNVYNAAPVGLYTLAQANESTFGAMIGDVLGVAAQYGLGNALISVPTTDGSAFPYVDCGFSGAVACYVDPSPGPWSTYYFETSAFDLFNGGLAFTAAASAYAQTHGGSLPLTAAQFSVNATDMAPTIPTGQATQYIPCVINNTNPAHALVDNFGANSVQVLGVGSVIGWQTQVNEGSSCSSNSYATTLTNGITEGSLFLEVETDAAFTDLNNCGPTLTTALNRLLASAPPTSCVY